MAKRDKKPADDLTVKAEDCYDPADYTLVHNDYLQRLRALESDPFRGELSVYRNGEFVVGVNAPHVDAVLEAIHAALDTSLAGPDAAVDTPREPE